MNPGAMHIAMWAVVSAPVAYFLIKGDILGAAQAVAFAGVGYAIGRSLR